MSFFFSVKSFVFKGERKIYNVDTNMQILWTNSKWFIASIQLMHFTHFPNDSIRSNFYKGKQFTCACRITNISFYLFLADDKKLNSPAQRMWWKSLQTLQQQQQQTLKGYASNVSLLLRVFSRCWKASGSRRFVRSVGRWVGRWWKSMAGVG